MLFSWLRLVIRGEIKQIKFNRIDALVLLWVLSSVTIYTLLRQTTVAFIYKMGFAFDAIGLYFLFRCLIRDMDDIIILVKSMAILCIPLSIMMGYEYITGNNVFSYFGGVPEFSEVREGRVRAQGPFQHPILAGTFGATAAPLFAALWWQPRAKLLSVISFISATCVFITSSSSGPLMAYVAGILGLLLWPYRSRMRVLRWGLVIAIIGLEIVMKAPFYYIIDRISSIVGGSGWYRSYLIEQAIRHFDDWWFLGTTDTASWMPFYITGRDQFADITNQYVAEGVNGGLLTLILFVSIIVYCCKYVGSLLKSNEGQTKQKVLMIWAIGVTLASHLVSFLSVSYYDQIVVLWYFIVAIIASLKNFEAAEKNLITNTK